MKIRKPNFWDYKRPNFLSFILLPLTLPLIINNYLIYKKRKKINMNIKNICIGNIYVGGTAKTPLSIKISQILNKLNFKTAIIKKFYHDQVDEQKIITHKSKLYCYNKRIDALYEAIKENIDIAIFDDGLQDRTINYDLKFVCFNNLTWIGNSFLIPAGPLREKIDSLKRFDAVFLNGNEENILVLKETIKKINPNIKIFETYYQPINIDQFNNKDKFLIFSGIGNPDTFKKTLLKNNFNIVKEIKFPDHHQYTQKDIDKIILNAKNLDAKILTTEKDYVKLDLNISNKINFLEVEVVIKKENDLINFIKSSI